jgi:adenylate cyclase
MAADVDIEALGLLDGLGDDARRERAELIAWLLDRGFKLEHIRASVYPASKIPTRRCCCARTERPRRGRSGFSTWA